MGDSSNLYTSLERLGYASLSDFFIANPASSPFSAAPLLSTGDVRYAPVDIEIALRDECNRRDDFHFFARVTLFTALTSFKPQGWGQQHYLLAGHWVGMLGKGSDELASRCWSYLKGLGLKEGWRPESIFDPILDEALKRGFSSFPR